MRYFCWVIFVNLDPFLIGEICWTNLKFELGLNICFEFCTFLDIYIWVIFVFAWVRFVIMLAEYEFMTRGARNFMEESETRKP